MNFTSFTLALFDCLQVVLQVATYVIVMEVAAICIIMFVLEVASGSYSYKNVKY